MSSPEEKLDRIRELASELGWELALDDSGDEVHGIIIGNMEFIQEVLTGEIEPENFGIYSSMNDKELH